jgi:hypothetical protein
MRLLALYPPNQHSRLRTRPVARPGPGPNFSCGPRRQCRRCRRRPICCRRYRHRCWSRHCSNCRERIAMSTYISCRDPHGSHYNVFLPSLLLSHSCFLLFIPHTSLLVALCHSLMLFSSQLFFSCCAILTSSPSFAPVSSHLVSSLHSPEDSTHILYNHPSSLSSSLSAYVIASLSCRHTTDGTSKKMLSHMMSTETPISNNVLDQSYHAVSCCVYV